MNIIIAILIIKIHFLICNMAIAHLVIKVHYYRITHRGYHLSHGSNELLLYSSSSKDDNNNVTS